MKRGPFPVEGFSFRKRDQGFNPVFLRDVPIALGLEITWAHTVSASHCSNLGAYLFLPLKI